MNRAINWLAAALLALVLSAGHLLDGPSEIEAAQDVAADLIDAQASEAARVHTVARLTQPGYQP
jgi:hypothetical protein